MKHDEISFDGPRAGRAQRFRQAGVFEFRQVHAQDSHARFAERLVGLIDGPVEPLLAGLGIALVQTRRGPQLEHHPGKALQQRIVEFASHAGAFPGHQLKMVDQLADAQPVRAPNNQRP